MPLQVSAALRAAAPKTSGIAARWRHSISISLFQRQLLIWHMKC
jgi:hypothetical protein